MRVFDEIFSLEAMNTAIIIMKQEINFLNGF